MVHESFRRFALVALCGALWLPIVQAQDDDKSDKQTGKEGVSSSSKRTIAVRIASGKHWIGVLPVPIDDALKAQLNLQDRLIVHHVLPETPAGKAGLQAHDILLRFGDKEIANMEDLIGAVTANNDQEAKLTVLRGGKEVTLSVKPEERPAEEKLQELLPKHKTEDITRRLGQALKGDQGDTFIWRGVGPGVWSRSAKQNAEFPNGLSITVNKEDDKPANITAKKDGKTYETTADKLDILPEDIRSHVERLLHGPQIVSWGPDGKGVDGALRYRLNAEQFQQAHEDAAKALRHHVEVRKLEGEGGAVSDLRKEVEALRKAVEELKGSKDKKAEKSDSKHDKDDSDKNEKADRAI